MLRDLYDEIGPFPLVMLVVILLLVGLITYSIKVVSEDKERLVNMCMDDGHPEYVCRSIVKGNKPSTTVMPIYIPK